MLDALTEGQEAQAVSENIVITQDDVEQADSQDHPDKDVRDNSAWKVMAVRSNGSIPEQCSQGPGIWTCDGRKVDEGWKTGVVPVGNGLVDEVGDEDDLRTPEVVAGPEEDPGKGEQVVQDEVRCHIGSGCDESGVLVEEVPDIAELGEKQEDPGSRSRTLVFKRWN